MVKPQAKAMTNTQRVICELAAIARLWKDNINAEVSVVPLLQAVAQFDGGFELMDRKGTLASKQQCCLEFIDILMQCAAESLSVLVDLEVRAPQTCRDKQNCCGFREGRLYPECATLVQALETFKENFAIQLVQFGWCTSGCDRSVTTVQHDNKLREAIDDKMVSLDLLLSKTFLATCIEDCKRWDADDKTGCQQKGRAGAKRFDSLPQVLIIDLKRANQVCFLNCYTM